ncbi:SDR family oxidoreductase [Galbitalea soli]|uniref:SDR family oxidoreductase n=1 Tax=Galbitalea soli TaxID=1268042 RepID=A0A7C9TPI3_9MICO|nr:SDR family oxidoreductase [Galbitalea soli]NEM90042.1 SDR family oxidoreductase [Galbitalea soli]NYJ30749.1 NAD(P)-dependent dehydrogenase (short-subunit alcohol dehydrogenase family) [Galbitalea soli]
MTRFVNKVAIVSGGGSGIGAEISRELAAEGASVVVTDIKLEAAQAALEYTAQGVRTNAVGPGFIDTPLVRASLSPEAITALEAEHATGRLGTDKEVVALTLFLLSDAASFISGSYHLVDGGYSAH